MTTTQDPHDRLLAKAFGDLDTRPFVWCFDEDQCAGGYAESAPIFFTEGPSAEELVTPHGQPVALPPAPEHSTLVTITINTSNTPPAAPQELREGETYISSWSELQYEMTNGQMGTPPQPLRRYQPQQK